MSRSYGGRGKRPGDGPERDPHNIPKDPSRLPAPGSKANALVPTRIDTSKRAIAFGIDVLVGYLLGIVVAFIPLINTILDSQISMVAYLLVKDWLFEGRGIGKNLMGLQVVDLATGQPLSLKQSVKRNVVLVAPLVLMWVVGLALRLVPITQVKEIAGSAANIAGILYVLVVLPMECYRVSTRDDGMRLGDSLANTALVEMPMDFSRIFPRT